MSIYYFQFPNYSYNKYLILLESKHNIAIFNIDSDFTLLQYFISYINIIISRVSLYNMIIVHLFQFNDLLIQHQKLSQKTLNF